MKGITCKIGLLNNNTSNVLLDAVLTDLGRQFLARNDGSFSIVKFALCDDEVDYGIIQKYGRSVGIEKITKNTPIFEALTNPSHAIKYKLVSVSNPNLLRLPSLTLSGDSNVDGTSNTVTLVELRDQTFIVDVPNLFLQLVSTTPENIDGQQRAQYLLSRSPTENSFGGSSCQFTLNVKSLTDSIFAVYGSTTNKQIIKTYVRVTGLQSGAVKDIAVYVNKAL